MSTFSDRPSTQRDWLGHSIQVGLLLVTIGLPVFIWASYQNATTAAILTRIDRQERDLTEYRAFQTVVTNQMLDVSKTLVKIDTQLEIIERNKPKR